MTRRRIARRNDIFVSTRLLALLTIVGVFPAGTVAAELDDERHSQPKRAAPLLRKAIA
jgi:hypothetical protein